jgi:predicted O-methyltransferase YrrM
MNIVQKLYRGDDARRTRLHDEKGNMVSPGRLIRNGSRACLSGAGRLFLNRRPQLPWISYDAIAMLKRHLREDSRVLEFGSGMSTVWYGQRASYVRSVENHRPWFERVGTHIRLRKLESVDHVFAESAEEYSRAGVGLGDFDLIMIDGDFRSQCAFRSIPLLAPGGILYLDNSDKHTRNGGDIRKAESICVNYARANHLHFEYYTDFAPTQLTPNQGLLVRNFMPAGGQ